MILFDEDYLSIYKKMREEKDRVDYYVRKDFKKIQRDFVGSTSAPVWSYKLVSLPKTNNTYLVYYYALNYKEMKSGSFFYGSVLLLDTKEGQRMAIALRRTKIYDGSREWYLHTDVIHAFTGHFFSRYRERMKFPDSMSTYDVIASFFGRCGGYFHRLDYDEVVLEKNRKPDGGAWGIDDGMTLTTEEYPELDGHVIPIIKHGTFLSRNEFKSNQEESTPTQREMRHWCIDHYK